jgi:hypothetical protein
MAYIPKNLAGSVISHEKFCLLFCFKMAYIPKKISVLTGCAPACQLIFRKI